MASSLHRNARALEARRRVENGYKEMDMVVTSDRRVLQMANFENHTASKIERKTKHQMFEQKKKEYEDRLIVRKKKLADIYNQEIEQWRREVLAKEETIEERKQKIMERAYALRDAREKTRQVYVQKRLQDQWRDACDDARTLDSKAALLYMNQERLRQIQEKKDKKQQLSKQEDSFLEAWNRQLDEMERRDREKREHHHQMEVANSAAIMKQIEDNERMKEEHYWKSIQEDEAELSRLRQEIEDEERLQRQRALEARQRGKEVLAFNADNRKYREEESLVEREQDGVLLDYALRKEAEQIAAEEAKRAGQRQAALQYRKYLEEQMVKEAEDTAFVDEIRKREEEKVWKARDDALKARDDARNYLMKMVDEGRQEQIRHKDERERAEREHDKIFARKFLDEADEAVRKERAEAERRRQIATDNNTRLTQQISLRQQQEMRVKQEEYLADKQMKHMERMHQQRLAEQAGSVRLAFPLQKNQWYT